MTVDQDISKVTPKGLDAVRGFTNKTLMDVFYLMNPILAEMIYHESASQLNMQYTQFMQRNPDFKGKVSILAHSLGSIICFDLLCNQSYEKFIKNKGNILAWEETLQIPSEPTEKNPFWSTCPKDCPQLVFQVDTLFTIGSPLGMFLALRGQNPMWSIPKCTNLVNIFHTYDPVAYRIEPWIDARFENVEPRIVKACNKSSGKRTHTAIMDYLSSSNKAKQEEVLQPVETEFVKRYDYKLQLGISDPLNWTSYTSSLSAHTSYWTSKDLMLLILERTSHELLI